MRLTRIRDLVKEVNERNPPSDAVVFSVSEGRGIIPQTEIFTKQVATSDRSKYKRIRYGDVVFNPYLLWNRAVGVCFAEQGGCVSPAYPVLRPVQSGTERFLHYFFRSPVLTETVDAIATGSVTRRRTAPLDDILDLAFDLPTSDERIVVNALLTTFDGKIEVNRRMNETIEALAQAEFRTVKDEGEPGTLGDIAENPKRGVDPSEIDVRTPYIGLEHMPRRSIALGEWDTAGHLESGKARFHRGEILFGKLRPYFHKVGVAPLDGVCSTDILTIVPKKPAWFGLLLCHLSSKELIDHTDACSTGTKMPRASWSDIARYEIALPPEPVAAKLTGVIQPLVERIIANIHESRTLAALRDALLPKLLSGAIRISEKQ